MINITRFYKTLLDDVFYGIADDVFIQQPSPEKNDAEPNYQAKRRKSGISQPTLAKKWLQSLLSLRIHADSSARRLAAILIKHKL